MILVPFFVLFILTGWGGDANRYICLAIFVVASITDWFDGHLARKNNLVTNFGKFMDPLADKLLVCSALICMIELDRLPAWFVIIIIAREFIISGFRLIAAENGVVIAANYWGKFKTASQMVMIILLILNFGGVFEILTQIFVWVSLALTVISLITYIVQNKNVITFTLDKPQYLSVEFNGDRLHNLHLFANPMETETYSKEEKGVMYFGPGVHRPKDLPNNQIRIPGNTTVYLAPGAVVKAKLLLDKVENVRIIGRGILDHPVRGIEITDSKNIVIDGITVVNPDHYTVFGGGAEGVTIKNLKSFSCKGWSDGIDMMCCHDVLIDNVFMRNSDDCIALYNHRWNWWGGSDNITVQNSILWADIAHPINVGGHGDPNSPTGEIIENLVFRNIDILEHDEDDVPYQGCMAIDAGDRNRVKNILFEDIRVESIQEGRLFHINVRFNGKYDKQPGQSIDGVTFRNITYNGVGENPSLIKGLDKDRMVRDVTFENVVVNGKKMKDLSGFITNEYIERIEVK